MADADHSARVLVDDRQDAVVDVEGLVALAGAVLAGEGMARSEVSISFVTQDEIAALNERYAGSDGPTDVLSFALDEEDRDEDGVRILGDVVIAPSVAARNNPSDPAAELRLLVAHGILHLLGHDHHDDPAKAEMWSRQERYTGVRVP